MKKPLPGRVARLEEIRRPLPASEAAELRDLERAFEARFPGPLPDAFATYTHAQLDDFLGYQASDTPRRVDELRQRAKSPARLRKPLSPSRSRR